MAFIGNKDTDKLILLNLDDRDLLIACNINKYARQILCDNTFFLTRLSQKFPHSKKFKPEKLSWKEYYLTIVQLKDKMEKIYNFDFVDGNVYKYWDILSKEKDLDYSLERAARAGLEDLVYYFVNLDPGYFGEEYDWNYALHEAFYSGNSKLIEYFLERGANDYDTALRVAAKANNKEYVDFFLSIGININEGIYGAAERNNIDLISYLFGQIKDDPVKLKSGYEAGILGAIRGGHEELFYDLVRNSGENPAEWSIEEKNRALKNAAYVGNITLFNYFLKLGADSYAEALYSAIRGKVKNIYYFIDKLLELDPNIPLDMIIFHAFLNNRQDIIGYIKNRKP